MRKRILLSIILFVTVVITAWAVVRYKHVFSNTLHEIAKNSTNVPVNEVDAWNLAVENVKADRGQEGSGAIEIPAELKHYSESHWFLATQVAEIAKYHINTCQDYVDLADTIQRGEMVAVPIVTDTYVLFGVGAKADDEVFSRFEDDHEIGLYNETQLS